MEEIWIVSYIDTEYDGNQVKIESIYNNEDEAYTVWKEIDFEKDGAFLDHWIKSKNGKWYCLSDD